MARLCPTVTFVALGALTLAGCNAAADPEASIDSGASEGSDDSDDSDVSEASDNSDDVGAETENDGDGDGDGDGPAETGGDQSETGSDQGESEENEGPVELCPGANKPQPCVGGEVAGYACEAVELLSIMGSGEIGGGSISDSWGWTYRDRIFALVGTTKGTAFLEVTDPCSPIYLGLMPQSSDSNAIWHDIKVWDHYAFVVSEAKGHGVQVFDLNRLLDATEGETFDEDAYYDGFGSAHNIAIDPDHPYAYGVGTGSCSGGLHIMDLADPLNPTQAGCWGEAGYIHDAHCLTYNGPDTDHVGKELCLTANGGGKAFSIVDVTDKSAPIELSRGKYPTPAYTHQGWMTDDHKYFLLGDELDEGKSQEYTRTMIFNVEDLDEPVLIAEHQGTTKATDHNMYVIKDKVYQSNYGSGLQVLDLSNVAAGELTQIAWFDTRPDGEKGMNGAWNTYPYFWNGRVVMITGGGKVAFVTLTDTPPG